MRRVSAAVYNVGTRHGVSVNPATRRDVIPWRLNNENKKRRLNETSLQVAVFADAARYVPTTNFNF